MDSEYVEVHGIMPPVPSSRYEQVKVE